MINRAKFINVACSSNGKSTRLIYDDEDIDIQNDEREKEQKKLTLKMLWLLSTIA